MTLPPVCIVRVVQTASPVVVRVPRSAPPPVVRTIERGPPGPPGEKGETGERGAIGPPGGQAVKYPVPQPSAQWIIAHGLGRYPSVTLVDTAGDVFDADVRYVDADTIIVTIIAPVAGVAHLN